MTAPDLTPAERATVDRIEQAPDALGLREEVAEVVEPLLSEHARYREGYDRTCRSCCTLRVEALEAADALLPLIERREAEAAKRAAGIAAFGPRFWPRVKVGAQRECWPWTGPTLPFGHGRVDSPAGNTAHRYAWASAHGRLPEADEVVRHICDNPPCCNPSHLEIGTQLENVRDMHERGRNNPTRGPRSTCRKGHALTPENTLVRPNGARRCKTCDRDWGQCRRERLLVAQCPRCEQVSSVYNLVRHLRSKHGEEWTPQALRDRADWIGGTR